MARHCVTMRADALGKRASKVDGCRSADRAPVEHPLPGPALQPCPRQTLKHFEGVATPRA